MGQLFELVRRNMRVYLRDKGAVFFSLMAMLVVIMLMVFFLGDMNVDAITGILGELPFRDASLDKENAEKLVYIWTAAGILSINAVTVTLACFSAMIKDKTSGKICSIYTAPVSRTAVSAGYIASAWISSMVICIATLAIIEIYGMINGVEAFSLAAHLKLLGMIAVNSFAYASMMYLAAILVKTEGAWSGMGTVIGTLVGFLGGIYVPVGALAQGIVSAMKCTPVFYGASMFRSVMTEEILKETFRGAPAEMIAEYKEAMGITLTVFDYEVTEGICMAVLAICGLVFLGLGVLFTELGRKTDR